jgi:hypothetical protein
MNYTIELLKSNELGFKAWYNFYFRPRKDISKRNYFTNSTKIFIAGFPRSGNTYATFLLRNIFQDFEFSHHFHTTGAIKVALSQKIPVLVLVRDPKNTITSFYLKLLALQNQKFDGVIDEKLLRTIIRFYILFHKDLLKLSSKIKIMLFNDLIANPIGFLSTVKNSTNFNISQEVIVSKFEEVQRKDFGAKDALGSSLPNETKENYKSLLLQKLIVLDGFAECEDLFSKIERLKQ